MNLKKIFFLSFLVVISFSLVSFKLSSKIEKKVKKEVKKTFDTTDFILQPFVIETDSVLDLKVPFTDDNFRTIEIGEKLVGYAYVGEGLSKTAEFDFLVVFDENLIIKHTKVLIYREEYGGEIASPRWLKQFIGKSETSSLIYKKDIAAISGATISVKSMTNEINDLLNSIGVLHENKIL